MRTMQYGDFDKLSSTAAAAAPFPHLLCPNFIRTETLDAVHSDFPAVPEAGSFPLPSLHCQGAFAELVNEIRSVPMAEILADKLQSPIVSRPTMVTVRGFCRATDGKIHLDSGGKMVTVLLYLNKTWDDNTGGRLRLLNNGDNLDDYFLETPPGNGALLAFRCDNNAWHGHLPYTGERRSIQLNWVVSATYQRREAVRHRISAALKKTRAALRAPFGRA